MRLGVFERRADGQAVTARDRHQVLGDRRDGVLVDRRFEPEFARVLQHVENRRIGGCVGQRRRGGVDDGNALLYGFEHAQRPQAGIAVGVELHRYVPGLGQNRRHQGAGALRLEQATRVLEADPGRAQPRGLTCQVAVIVVGVDRRDGVDQVDDRIQAGPAGIDHQALPVGGGVGRVGNTHLPHAIGGQAFDEQPVDLRRGVFEGQVARGDDAQLCCGTRGGHAPHAFPGIVLQIAHHLLEEGDVKYLHGLVTDAVELVDDRQHHVGAQRTRPQAGVAVTQGRVDEMQGLHGVGPNANFLVQDKTPFGLVEACPERRRRAFPP